MQSEETWMELHVLHDHGWSISALAREFGLDWRTARRYVRADKSPRYRPRACPAELTAAQLAHVERRLATCPNLRVTVLERELAGRMDTRFIHEPASKDHYPAASRDDAEPIVRFETAPGVQVQGDWTDCGTWPIGDGSAPLYAWVSILGYSGRPAMRFRLDKTRSSTLRAIVRTIDDLGGADRRDADRPGSGLHRPARSDDSPIYAPAWVDTAANLGTRPSACRPIGPRQRARSSGSTARSRKTSSPGYGPGSALASHYRRL